jgi:hypothetical protein
MDIPLSAILTTTHQLGSYRYFISSVQPHKSASLVILLLDTDRNEVSRIHKIIEGDEYAGWGADDSYLDAIVDKEVRRAIGEPELVYQADPVASPKKRGRPKKTEPLVEQEITEPLVEETISTDSE